MFFISPTLKRITENTMETILIKKKDVIQKLMNSRAIIISNVKLKPDLGIKYFFLLLG